MTVEDHVMSDYQAAVADNQLDDECRKIIETSLLPHQQEHVRLLETLRRPT